MTRNAVLQVQPTPPKLDGRRRRSDASRARIVAAMLELVQQGVISPSAEQVAERAGLGRRTVFRLFKDMEQLYAEMHATMIGRLERIMADPIEGADWRARLDSLVDRRIRLFEEILAIKTAADAHRHRSKFLQSTHAELSRMLRELMGFLLPREIKGDRLLVEALDGALSFDLWRRLRLDQRLSADDASAVWKRLVAALLDAAGAPTVRKPM